MPKHYLFYVSYFLVSLVEHICTLQVSVVRTVAIVHYKLPYTYSRVLLTSWEGCLRNTYNFRNILCQTNSALHVTRFRTKWISVGLFVLLGIHLPRKMGLRVKIACLI